MTGPREFVDDPEFLLDTDDPDNVDYDAVASDDDEFPDDWEHLGIGQMLLDEMDAMDDIFG